MFYQPPMAFRWCYQFVMKKGETRELFLKRKLKELSEKREERINKYIIPIEIQMQIIRDRLNID